MTTEEYLKDLLTKLKQVIPHQWRVQSFSKNKPVATVMAYIDARDAMDMLDKHCLYGWTRRHYEVDKKVYCSVGIYMPDGTLHERSDCGVESNQDAEKGQASDAFKRACVNWGVGRFLYDMDIQYVDTNEAKTGGNYPYCVDEKGGKIWDLTKHINDKINNAKKPQPKQVKEPTTEEKVDNMQGKTPSKVSEAVKAELSKCKTHADLKTVWNNHKELHDSEDFKLYYRVKHEEITAKIK